MVDLSITDAGKFHC